MPDHRESDDDVICDRNVHSEAIKFFLENLQINSSDISDEVMNCYKLAFTHRSVGGEEYSYERLEFLGDRVLNLIVAKYLFNEKGSLPHGVMSKKMECVKNDNLGEFVKMNSFFPEDVIKIGNGTPLTPKICAQIFEALIGAIYLHQGFEKVESVVLSIFKDEIETFVPVRYKEILNEICQAHNSSLPVVYERDKKEGPDHQPTFYFHVKIGDVVVGKGSGTTITEAEQDAAKNALENQPLIRD